MKGKKETNKQKTKTEPSKQTEKERNGESKK
jgi:hypothetical protein